MNLLKNILDNSEKKGIGSLISHCSQGRGELINIKLINDLTSGVDVQKNLVIQVFSNITIYELRGVISKNIKTVWDQVLNKIIIYFF